MSVWVGVAGAAAVLAWLLAAPPWRDGPGGLLRVAAAVLLLAGLFEVSCRLPSRAAAPRLRVLIDRSGSMDVPGTGGTTRAHAGRAWLEGESF